MPKPEIQEGVKPSSPPRTARLVVVTSDGQLVGSLPPTPVATPFWQSILPVVEAVKAKFGIEVTILRLLETNSLGSKGGEVTYLAEVSRRSDLAGLPLEPWLHELADDPLRLPYAKPRGPAADLEWATRILGGKGIQVVGKPVQIRTWNLSSIWRIPISGASVWLKAVPPFFAHEAKLIELLSGEPVPHLVGYEECRTLLYEVPGHDLYDADLQTLLSMVEIVVQIQAKYASQMESLINIGLPDWRGEKLLTDVENLLTRVAAELDDGDRTALSDFVSQFPVRSRMLSECGIPDTLVHGDLHPGNFRGDEEDIRLIDWGDSGLGNPLLDQSAFIECISGPNVGKVRDRWKSLWRNAVPGCDPARAVELVRPISAALRAVKYQMFLDNIERSERVYHCSDPADWLHETAMEFRKSPSL